MAWGKFKLLLAAVFLLAGCDAPEGATWNASLPWSTREYHTQNAYDFAAAVAKITEGRLEIKVFPGAVLGFKGPETIRALEEKLVDMAEMPAFQEAGTEPVLGMESLPYLVDNQEELRLLYSLSRPAIEAAYQRHGLRVLYIVPWPRQNIYTKIKIETLADMKGLRIRTYDRNTSELMERLGLIPVQLPSSDVVPALASGMIDAVMTSTTTGAAQSYWQFLPYIYRTNHVWISNIMAVSQDSWDQLSEADQKAVAALAAEMEAGFWRVAADDDQKKLEILLKNGMQVFEINDKLLNEMRKKSTPIWRQYMARVDPETRAILEQFLAESGKQAGS